MPEDMETIAKLNGTLIFLMGLENLGKITTSLISNGKNENTKTAIIHVNTDNTTDIIISTLSDIADKAAKTNIKAPAVIVVGDVINLYNNKGDNKSC
jgi:uroporphyrinogen III methyltransferase/synthase